jgi:hypothetical protein
MAVKFCTAINLVGLETYLVGWLLVDLINSPCSNSMASTRIKTTDRDPG